MITLRVDKLPNKMSVKAFVEFVIKILRPDVYAYIVHDKDSSATGGMAEPHIHLILHFNNSRYLRSIAKQIQVEENFLVKWRGSIDRGFLYLIHSTESSKNRYQYPADSVVASFDYVAFIEEYHTKRKEKIIENSIKTKLELLLAGKMTKDEVINSLSAFEQSRYKKQITDTYNRKLEIDTKNWIAKKKAENRPSNVIWIYGPASSGKSSLGYDLASRSGDEIYIAGSSRDPFENYTSNYHTAILDDLRSNCGLTYADLLRILDPYAVGGKEVYASSRYTDKALALDLIIITCPQSPSEFYREMFHISEFTQNNLDPFDQLRRRLSLVMYLSQHAIFRAEYNGRDYEPDPTSAVKNEYSHFARTSSLDWDNGKDLFKKYMIDDKPKTSVKPIIVDK